MRRVDLPADHPDGGQAAQSVPAAEGEVGQVRPVHQGGERELVGGVDFVVFAVAGAAVAAGAAGSAGAAGAAVVRAPRRT